MTKPKRDRSVYQKEWYQKNREKHLENVRENHRALKILVVNHYGGKCACCGESELDFMAIDHINNDGNEHRKTIGSGGRLHAWLRREGFPEGFQVLCHNCNFSKHLNNGVCIHQL